MSKTSRLFSWMCAGAAVWLSARAVMRYHRRISFAGRLVLITGGSRGLGLIMARQLAAEGAQLILCARDTAELAKAGSELIRGGAKVSLLTCDVTDQATLRTMAKHVLETIGVPDVIINNAGIISMSPLASLTEQDFEQSMRTHFYASLWLNDEFLPAMKQRGFGRIVNIASIGGLISVPHLLPYCASKFALVGYSEGLRHHVAGDGILVTTVCPGLMRTGSPRQALFKGRYREEYAWFKVSGSLPILSINAERAARRIINACRDGDAKVILGLTANVAAGFQALFPNLTAEMLTLAHSMLPEPPANDDRTAHRGYESKSKISESFLTSLTDQAARQNNEIDGSDSNGLFEEREPD